LTTISHLRIARSTDGINFDVDSHPTIRPERSTELFGIEDPRITQMGSTYWVTYKAVSPLGVAAGLACTDDFERFEPRGEIFGPGTTNVVIFPKMFDDEYVAWLRPSPGPIGSPGVWAARSPDLDLRYWGRFHPVFSPRPGMWDCSRVGPGGPPIETDEGWLAIYHGTDQSDSYRLGVVLIDQDDPTRVRARSSRPILEPTQPYETSGFHPNVVFSCGAHIGSDGTVTVYYGAADESICAFSTSVDALLSVAKR
jgi:predicted GH43/DUF377 family glycosyl hydrolase